MVHFVFDDMDKSLAISMLPTYGRSDNIFKSTIKEVYKILGADEQDYLCLITALLPFG